jgi:Bacterial regulatory proteins, gntR family
MLRLRPTEAIQLPERAIQSADAGQAESAGFGGRWHSSPLARNPDISNYRGLEVAEAGMALLNRPLYLQVRDVIIERIGKGEWKPGSALPNEGDLARQFGLSTGTLRKALDHLEAERVLTRRQGCGRPPSSGPTRMLV